MLRPEQKKKLVGHQIKFDSFPYEIWVDHKKSRIQLHLH